VTDTGTSTATPASPAEDAVVMMSVSTIPAKDAVVTVMRSPVGAHVGILYRADDDGARRHLHLAWHFRLQNDTAPPVEAFWVEPRLDELELSDVRASARLIAQRQQDGLVPYAFRALDARFDSAGTLQLNKSLGLTCATFVILVFDHAGIALLEMRTWNHDRSVERKREDDAAQSRLVGYLQGFDKQHAKLVEAEVGCTRIRAEEVAAASGMTGHPITFARAESVGRRVLEAILNPQTPSGPQPAQSSADLIPPEDVSASLESPAASHSPPA
jgi:hypothetical protein